MLRHLIRGGGLAWTACLLTTSFVASATAQETAPPSDPVGFTGGDSLFPDLIAPSEAVGPFANIFWTRGDAGSSFAIWENFADAVGPNSPGIRETISQIPTPSGTINLVQGIEGTPLPSLPAGGEASVEFVPLFGNAIITSTRNLYTGGGPGTVELITDADNLGVNYDTQIVLQVGSLGNVQDTSSFLLEYTDARGEEVALAAISTGPLAEFGDSGNPMGGVSEQSFAVWNIPRFNPEEFTLSYVVPSNLSSSTLILDVLTQESIVGDYTGDRVVGEADLIAFQSGFGSDTFSPDGNLDGVVNAADFVILRDSFTTVPAVVIDTAITAVPEPSAACLLIAVMLMACGTRTASVNASVTQRRTLL